jgi:hypothetical protein
MAQAIWTIIILINLIFLHACRAEMAAEIKKLKEQIKSKNNE